MNTSAAEPARAGIAFVCPRCRAPVAPSPDSYACTRCGARYPIVLGIPDFRVSPDPWISIEDDRAKGARLEHETAGMSFAQTVRAYWAMTPDTPPERAERFTAHVLEGEARSRDWLRGLGDAADPASPWLDLGCGTADIAAVADRSAVVVGVDVAFRWLVVARRRLAERGVRAHLVCGNAEALPFADGSFSRVLCVGTLEHCPDVSAVLRETRRVLTQSGNLHVRTVNRYSLLTEPHVGVWGVGWVPRRWADGFVRWRSGQRYLHHWPHGAGEIGRALRRAGFVHRRVDAARVLDAEWQRMSTRMRRAAAAYDRLRRIPMARALVSRVAPVLDASGTAP